MKNKSETTVNVVLQLATKDTDAPVSSDFKRWAAAALVEKHFSGRSSEVCVRVVDNEESAELNQRYRDRSGPTNVLSFACDSSLMPVEENEPHLLGDIVIAAPVVMAEAQRQGKRLVAHWAHLFVHGMLHLQGYEHAQVQAARRMESLETSILGRLGFSDPYRQGPCLSDE